jgi:hypothetical protein
MGERDSVANWSSSAREIKEFPSNSFQFAHGQPFRNPVG